MFTVVSWYTLNTPYKEIFDSHLLPTLIKEELPYKIYPMEPLKNWKENTNLKSLVIEKALSEIESDILILDADCTVNCYPELLDKIPMKYDMGLFYLDWGTWYGHTQGKKELCSGTIFLRNRPKVKKLIEDWKILTQRNNNKLVDQRFLELALKMNDTLNIYDLPIEYCYINSLPSGDKPLIECENPIITHYQASRLLKNKV